MAPTEDLKEAYHPTVDSVNRLKLAGGRLDSENPEVIPSTIQGRPRILV